MSSDLKIKKTETVEEWLERLPSKQSEILVELRQLIQEDAPQLEEHVKWSSPWYVGNGNVIYLACQKSYATFGVCQGAHLDNPDGLLEGTGKDMRHVKVFSMDDDLKDRLKALLECAVEYDS